MKFLSLVLAAVVFAAGPGRAAEVPDPVVITSGEAKALDARLAAVEKKLAAGGCACGDACPCGAAKTPARAGAKAGDTAPDGTPYLYPGMTMQPGVKYTLHPSGRIDLPGWDGRSDVTAAQVRAGQELVEQQYVTPGGGLAVRRVVRDIGAGPTVSAKPHAAGTDDHTHTCTRCGTTWGGRGHSHNCPRCGTPQYIQDQSGYSPARAAPATTYAPVYRVRSGGGCANGACGVPVQFSPFGR